MRQPLDREKYLKYERIAFAALMEKGCSPLQIRDKLQMTAPTYYRRMREYRQAREKLTCR